MNASNYDTVDLFKFIGSALVFLMHLNIFGNSFILKLSWELLARWAVPFFFIISSYFLFSKENKDNHNIDKQTLIKYIKRIASLYVVWFIINLPSIVYLRLIRLGVNQFSTWISFVKRALLSSTFTGSWYLLSSLFSACLLFMMSKHFKTNICILLSAIPHILCLLTSAYGGLLPSNISILLRWLYFPLNIFGGLLYFSLGKLLYEKRSSILSRSSFLLSFIALLSLAFLFFEVYFTINKDIYLSSDYTLAILPLAFLIAVLCIKSQYKIYHSILLRKVSTIVYCAQGNVLCVVPLISKWLGIKSFFLEGLIGIIIMSLIVTIILYAQEKKSPYCVQYLS